MGGGALLVLFKVRLARERYWLCRVRFVLLGWGYVLVAASRSRVFWGVFRLFFLDFVFCNMYYSCTTVPFKV